MLTIEGMIGLLSLCFTSFALGYAIGSKDNNKPQKQPPVSFENPDGYKLFEIFGLTVYRQLLSMNIIIILVNKMQAFAES